MTAAPAPTTPHPTRTQKEENPMTALSPVAPATGASTPAPRVSFGGVLRSEAIKLRSLRSNVWTAILAVAASSLFIGLIVVGLMLAPTSGEDPVAIITATFGDRPSVGVVGFAILFAQAVIAVLGVLIVSTERASRLLAVTAVAVPRRTPIFLAKLIVSAAAGFVLGLATSAIAYVLVQPALAAVGLQAWLVDAATVQVVVGGAVFLALISALATVLGSFFRSTAANLGLVLGIVLVAPGIVPVVPVVGGTLAQLLPTSVGMLLYQPFDEVGWTTVLTGLGVLLAELAVAGVAAGALWKRRDI
jgi:ABC-2 type transport system permease protein